ncbi:hypothetical protein MIB92_05125 [Aestuariirhabdus sp. Z084]|uniref:hypothetical protein n=1 Tax=Aestuariirhabdus haliotis TaxID=2918751 RepID=UPI00201B4201|nr:hypothetical protein [Aestuariirhabdus haliotis]MCL6415022.1 hypothetical protein [Aestuariirhabdus haliotis]MCL6418954.1 hypothetical protein [Aestuariirhabdus haliotis]
MNKRLMAVLFLLFLPVTYAKESTQGLGINSPKDALQSLQIDAFGSVSLANLLADITGGRVYRDRSGYAQGYVAIASQNDYGHYGSIDFEFKPPYDFTRADVLAQAKTMPGVKVTESGSRVYLRWQYQLFRCAVDFDEDPQYPLFQFICHYSEK